MLSLLAGPQKAEPHDSSNMILSGHDSVFFHSVAALPRCRISASTGKQASGNRKVFLPTLRVTTVMKTNQANTHRSHPGECRYALRRGEGILGTGLCRPGSHLQTRAGSALRRPPAAESAQGAAARRGPGAQGQGHGRKSCDDHGIIMGTMLDKHASNGRLSRLSRAQVAAGGAGNKCVALFPFHPLTSASAVLGPVCLSLALALSQACAQTNPPAFPGALGFGLRRRGIL
jgi:hypothetical protein